MRKAPEKKFKGKPAFVYTSDCHQVAAVKPPCVKVSKKDAETQGLGGWRCGSCNKPCKVSRNKAEADV